MQVIQLGNEEHKKYNSCIQTCMACREVGCVCMYIYVYVYICMCIYTQTGFLIHSFGIT